MAEFDLIPQDYRQLQRLRQQIKLYAIIYIIPVLAIVVGKVEMGRHINELGKTVSNFEQKRLIMQQQQQRLSDLKKKKSKFEGRVKILHSLRDGPAVEQMFLVIDRALVNGTWFKKWSFRHAGELNYVKKTEEINTGYFIIVKDEANPNRDQIWRFRTNMEISGQAVNHTVLAGLVDNLATSPEIDDVKILKTSLTKYIAGEVVNFDLAVTVNNQYVN